MRRITLWVLGTLSSLVLLFGYHTSLAGPMATSSPTSVQSGSSSASAASGTESGSGSGTGTDSTDSGTDSGTGSGTGSGSGGTTQTVTGAVAQTRWGPVQVQLSLASGKITKVDVVQYPNGNGRDQEINDYALPILTKETIDAQSADIDMISGATVTGEGYVTSLQSALDKAGI